MDPAGRGQLFAANFWDVPPRALAFGTDARLLITIARQPFVPAPASTACQQHRANFVAVSVQGRKDIPQENTTRRPQTQLSFVVPNWSY